MFTFEEIHLIEEALRLADDALHNEIATCPDVNVYADDIAEIEAKRVAIAALRDKVAALTIAIGE